jgi:hypothetical protein
MPAATTPLTVAEHDAVLLSFWRERFPEMVEFSVTLRDGNGKVVGYRLVRVEGGAEELSPSGISEALAGV